MLGFPDPESGSSPCPPAAARACDDPRPRSERLFGLGCRDALRLPAALRAALPGVRATAPLFGVLGALRAECGVPGTGGCGERERVSVGASVGQHHHAQRSQGLTVMTPKRQNESHTPAHANTHNTHSHTESVGLTTPGELPPSAPAGEPRELAPCTGLLISAGDDIVHDEPASVL